MSYQEKRTITSIITGALVLTAYCIEAFGLYQSGRMAQGDLRLWAITMLKYIVIGVLAAIVIQIVFHIMISISIAVREKLQDTQADDKYIEKKIGMEMVKDEMDRLIELKSTRFGLILAGIGFGWGLIVMALDSSPVMMLNIMFISYFAGSLVEDFAQLYFYRKGI
jgi:hypothetical protein